MPLVDTHTHLDGPARAGTLPATLARAKAAGVEAVIAVGTGPDDWGLYRDLARAHPGSISYTVGLHPCAVTADWERTLDGLESFWRNEAAPPGPPPAALGECGLDRFHLPKDPAESARVYGWQRAAFARQLQWAGKLGCPLVVHSRGAFPDCVEMIDRARLDWAKVVFHCFSEGPEEIAELGRRGGRGSFTGILTYKNADPVRAAARAQGLARLMLETDAPYLAPAPRRGERNESAFLRHTAEFAAQFFGVPFAELAAVTTANARAFFGMKGPG